MLVALWILRLNLEVVSGNFFISHYEQLRVYTGHLILRCCSNFRGYIFRVSSSDGEDNKGFRLWWHTPTKAVSGNQRGYLRTKPKRVLKIRIWRICSVSVVSCNMNYFPQHAGFKGWETQINSDICEVIVLNTSWKVRFVRNFWLLLKFIPVWL